MSSNATIKNVLQVKDAGITEELRLYRQWVNWRGELRQLKDGTEKLSKIPLSTDGRPASSTNPATWHSFDSCLEAHNAGLGDGVGFVLSDADPYIFIDLDHIVSPTEPTPE